MRWGLLFVILALAGCGITPTSTTPAPSTAKPATLSPALLPAFIPTVRAYGGGGYDEFQRQSMKDLGLDYVQGLVDFTWENIERGDDVWKWITTDEQMDALAQAGLRVIAFIICPKAPGLPWDDSIGRETPQFVAQYGEFAYQVANRYHDHPAWSGLVAVSGGSADVWDHGYPATDPEVVVPLLNAAYDGIKRADPDTIVIGFNLATTAHSSEDWEAFHERAFALSPRFDWFGVQSHGVPATWLESPGAYTGVAGLANVRKLLDAHGYAAKPLWLNEGGLGCGEDLGGLTDQDHAEQVAQIYIVARALNVNLRGWVYFEYFSKTHLFENGPDLGLLTSLDQRDPPEPRLAWRALQTMIRTVGFFDYDFVGQLSGEFSRPDPPFVYHFVHRERPEVKLWVVFSPTGITKQKPVSRPVAVHIAPATEATVIAMTGEQSTLTADGSGNVTVTSTGAPVYVKVGE